MENSLLPFSAFASVALDLSVDQLLDYGIPDAMVPLIKPGVRVSVPVRSQMRTGYIYEVKACSSLPKVKAIDSVLSDGELITQDLFQLAQWISRYYCAPIRQAFKLMLPSIVRKAGQHKEQLFVIRGKTKEELISLCKDLREKHPAQAAVLDVMLQVKKGILLTELLEQTSGSRSPVETLAKKGALVVDIVRVDRSPLVNEEYFKTKHKQLNEEQAEALAKIVGTIKHNRFETHLLHGVTGSGKTEVYLQAIEEALAQEKGTIMLVPEISLTAQTIQRFRSRFEGHIAVLHHRLSPGERYDEWHKIKRGDARIVIGARSAIFSPVKNLGLIIVDEEHEHSYKQSEEAPCYQARDVAVMRGKLCRAAVILGSATPSLESYYNASAGRYTLSVLKNRANTAAMPAVHIIDMKKEHERASGYTNFSAALLDGIKKRQEKGEQTILFLNRRGYHTTLLCQACQTAVRCAHCDVSLTFHLSRNQLNCHLCGFEVSPPPSCCPSCKSPNPMKFRGVGTEQIERALHAILPTIRTLRIDADTTKHKGSHQRLLRDFGSGKADVLIGTQMIAKGLHFPEVTLVGVINSDASLNLPDFRASETVFQLITQVAGRSGRGSLAGEVIIQTLMPDNTTIQVAAKQDYETFYQEEIEVRKIFSYPPFQQMAKVSFSGTDPKLTEQVAENVRARVKSGLPSAYETHAVVAGGYAKVKDKYRFQFLIRGASIYSISSLLQHISLSHAFPKDIRMFIDINPSSTFF